jgi:PAS domain S-box-containing protein
MTASNSSQDERAPPGKAESAAQAVQECFRGTFENAAVGIAHIDAEGRWLRINRKFLDMLGYSEEELRSLHFSDLTHPEDREEDLRQYGLLVRGELESYAIEKRYIRKGGLPIWVRVTRSPQRDNTGRVVHSLSVVEDIAARKQAEEVLGESRQRLGRIIESAMDAIVTVDEEQHIVLFNPAAERMFGCPAAQALGSPIDRFIPERFRQAHTQHIRNFGHTGQTTRAMGRLGAISGLRVDGEEFPIEASISQLEIGGRKLFNVILRDITERTRIEEALRQSERLSRERLAELQAVYISAPIGLCVVDTELRYRSINEMLAGINGLPIEQHLGRHIREVMLPSLCDVMEPLFLRVRDTGEAIREQEINEGPPLRRSWLVNLVPIRGPDGQLVAIINGVVQDITGRKQAEEALRESEEKFRSLAENIRAAVGMVQGTRFVHANRYMAEMLGYTVEEILSMDFPQLVHPAYRGMMIDRARRRQLGEPVPRSYEFVALTKSGEERWVEFWPTRTIYKGHPAILGAGFDITERKQTEEALRARTRGLKLLSDTATRLLMTAHPEDVLKDIFEELASNLDVEICINYFVSKDRPGLRLNFCTGVDDAGRRQIAFLEFGQGVCGTAAQIGERIVVQDVQRSTDPITELIRGLQLKAYACYPMKAYGRVVGTLAFGTRRRSHFAAEELDLMRAVADQVALAMERQELLNKVEERADELAQASKAKDHFMAVLSHELRTPLTPVLATVSMLQENPAFDTETREGLGVVRRNVELEARLIDDLLDVTRIARGKVELDKRPVALCTIIKSAVEVCQPDIDARQLNFGVDIGPTAPYIIVADAGRMQQVFWNLLRNSIKFTPPGGCVGIRCRREENGGHVIVEVNDSGEGIEPEALGRIFNAFEQAELSMRRQFGGLGLGLTISKALVEMHGGTIEAHSDGKGKGATFRLSLPLVKPAGTTLPREPIVPTPTAHEGVPVALRILLVEDHGDTARIMKLLLERRGHEVLTASDVATALELATRESIDLLISDLGLPDGSGLDVMRELRRRRPDLRGIALSGYGMDADLQRSREAGFMEHLIKPVQVAELQAAIGRAVSRED